MILTGIKRSACCTLLALSLIVPASLLAAPLIDDDFNKESLDPNIWHIPTWVSDNDGTFVGRTQFRCTPVPLPTVTDGNAILTVETYNPTGISFYGTDLIANQSADVTRGIHITVRAKMNTSTRGIVGGIFLYALKPQSTTLHDEIDFEMLTNSVNGVQTNIYENEPLGPGHPQFIPYQTGSITDYHIYEIEWIADTVTWMVDGNIVRTKQSSIASEAMSFHLNIWVPDGDEWPEAYDGNLQPTTDPHLNQIYSMSVDYVRVEYIDSSQHAENSTSILPLLLLKDN